MDLMRNIAQDVAIDTMNIVFNTASSIGLQSLYPTELNTKIMETFKITQEMNMEEMMEILEKNKEKLIQMYQSEVK